MNTPHIKDAIKQARKEGNKKVVSFTGDDLDHSKYMAALQNEQLETYVQKYYHNGGCYSSVILMRQPKAVKNLL